MIVLVIQNVNICIFFTASDVFFFVRKQTGRGGCCAHCNEQVKTVILVDGCKFSENDGLDFTFIWVHDRRNDPRRSESIRVDPS